MLCWRRLLGAGLWLAAISVLSIGDAHAQAVQSTSPGQIEKRFEEPLRAREIPEADIPRIEGQVTPEEARQVRFILSGLVVEGATVFSDAEFVPIYEALLAREVSLADMYDIAAAITAKYQEAGYTLSRAVVPPQEVSLGVIHIRVIEGYLDRIVFQGEVQGPQELLQRYAEKITTVQPLRRDVLERYLLLMDDLPGVTVSHALTPSAANSGAHTLTINLQHQTVEGFARLDNRGSRYVGPYQGWLGIGLNSALGFYENIRARFITASQTEELRYFDLAYTQNIGTEGTKVTLSGSHSRSMPGFTLEDDNIESRGLQGEISLIHPLIRSQDEDLFLTSRFTARNAERDEQGILVFDDRLRVIRAGVRYGFADGLRGRNLAVVEASQGIDGLGATDNGSALLSRADGRHDFTKATLDLSRYQPLVPQWGLLLTATGQKSAHKLLLSEQIGLGGEAFGRAYDPSEITGDDGVAFRVELQHDGAISGDGLLRQYQLYGFYDAGEVWNRGSDDSAALASTGIGARVLAAGNLLGTLELAKPLTRSVEAMGDDGKDVRLFFTLTATF